MTSTYTPLLILLTTLTLRSPPLTAANRHTTTSPFRSHSIPVPTTSINAPPTTFFEVTKPISLPKTKPCSYLLLQHDFAYTYGKSPVLADYKPPSHCPSQNFAKIVLELTATCKGNQYDRIFGVWLSGVEIFRSCTAEPFPSGIIWTVKKDITRYYSLLMRNQTLAVYLGNIVDRHYTGVYHINITARFYPAESGEFVNGQPDLILPISRNLPLNDGLWFEIENSNDVKSKEFAIPRNTYRAVLEVYVSFHENDEFWYGNYPNEYISENELTWSSGNGPFREVVVILDNNFIVGVVWPFTVIFPGGVIPLMWQPITAIGSFDLPSYDIEITPWLGQILDGKNHTFSFGVNNAVNVWYINANLHIWLDSKSHETQAEVLEYEQSPVSFSHVSSFKGFDGLFVTNVSRLIASRGWVKSSRGVVTTTSVQRLGYSNRMVLGHYALLQIVNQVINVNSTVFTEMASCPVRSSSLSRRFSICLHEDSFDRDDGTYVEKANVSLEFDEKRREVSGVGVFTSKLTNLQNAEANMVGKGNSVISGLASVQQEYRYTSDDSCYTRIVSCSNYTIINDKEDDKCGK